MAPSGAATRASGHSLPHSSSTDGQPSSEGQIGASPGLLLRTSSFGIRPGARSATVMPASSEAVEPPPAVGQEAGERAPAPGAALRALGAGGGIQQVATVSSDGEAGNGGRFTLWRSMKTTRFGNILAILALTLTIPSLVVAIYFGYESVVLGDKSFTATMYATCAQVEQAKASLYCQSLLAKGVDSFATVRRRGQAELELEMYPGIRIDGSLRRASAYLWIAFVNLVLWCVTWPDLVIDWCLTRMASPRGPMTAAMLGFLQSTTYGLYYGVLFLPLRNFTERYGRSKTAQWSIAALTGYLLPILTVYDGSRGWRMYDFLDVHGKLWLMWTLIAPLHPILEYRSQFVSVDPFERAIENFVVGTAGNILFPWLTDWVYPFVSEGEEISSGLAAILITVAMVLGPALEYIRIQHGLFLSFKVALWAILANAWLRLWIRRQPDDRQRVDYLELGEAE